MVKESRRDARTPSFLTRLREKAGLDRAVSLTLFGNGWAVLAGGITILLIAHFLTPVQQGFYYTFSGFLGATILFELGLSYVILQFASHERATLEWTPEGTLSGDPDAKARLAQMLRISLIWYGAISLLIIATVLPGGLLFFRQHTPAGTSVTWQVPWMWLTVISAGTLAFSPVLAVLEGCGLIAEIAALRAVQNVVSSLLLWSALVLGWGLYAAPLSGLALLVCSSVWLWQRQRPFLRDLFSLAQSVRQQGTAIFSWREEVWPFQWRIACSGVSAYLIFQLFTPVLFALHGPVAAGQMGLSLSISGAVGMIALTWLNTRAKTFGMLIAGQKWQQLDAIFFPNLWLSWSVAVFGGALGWVVAWYLRHQGYPLSHRILDPLPLGLLVAAMFINHLLTGEALYLRAHKQEPFMTLSLVSAVAIAFCDLLLGKSYGATGMMLGYFLVNLVGLGVGTWILARKRRQWHAAPLAGYNDGTGNQ